MAPRDRSLNEGVLKGGASQYQAGPTVQLFDGSVVDAVGGPGGELAEPVSELVEEQVLPAFLPALLHPL